MPSEQELAAAYEAMPTDKWDYVAPPRWSWVARCIADFAPNQRVLDVGCFRGDFLNSLPSSIERYGIEPSPGACAIAASRGIRIVGRDAMANLDGFEAKFGAIVLMDVAEHLPNPRVVFGHLTKFLAPGGVLIVLTGNADCWLAQRSLPFYWYMSFPIHLVYLGDRHFAYLASSDGWTIRRQLHYAHREEGVIAAMRDLEIGLRTWIWRRWLMGGSVGNLVSKTRLFRKLSGASSPPLLFRVRDHLGIALVKAAGQ